MNIIGKDQPYVGLEKHFQESATKLIRSKYPDLVYLHPANEGRRSRNHNISLLRAGLLPGVSDIIILKPNIKYHGLIIELKVLRGKLRPNQKLFLNKVSEEGYAAYVCYSLDTLDTLITNYLNNSL